MEYVEDFKWKKGMTVAELAEQLGKVGFQSVELDRAAKIIIKMKQEGAKIYFTFTSNMVTSGLRGFFAQIIKLGLVDAIVTTAGGLEEDIMKATGEKFPISHFRADDVALHEKGLNRVGNLLIPNESYIKFEASMHEMIEKLYKKKPRWSVSDMFKEIGLMISDENSILYQAAKKNIPVFCPAVTDGSMGFHFYMFQQDHSDFVIDVVKDFENLLMSSSQDEKKGIIALGGGISKHHAVLGGLINGGMDYAVYITTARETSGSMSGATTSEAKSWGKIKDNSDAVTVNGDVTILFPIAMIRALEDLDKEGMLNDS